MFVTLLLACSLFGPHGAPTGTLLAIEEVDGQPRTVLVDVASGARQPVEVAGDGVFPGPPDPRGTHLLLVATEEGDGGHRERLTLLPRAGGEPTVLAPAAEMIRHPSFSPDGSFIVFESSANSFRDLYRVNRDGSGLVRLTDAPHGSFEPQVSPDGQRIVFASSRDGNAEIYVMAADGSDPTRLTESREDDTRPGWLPDGRIAWLHQMGASKLLWRMNADGTQAHVVRRRTTPTIDHDWVVSPDGQRIAITMQSSPRELDLVLFDVASKESTVVGGPGVDEMPTFSPDGRWLVWTGNQSGDPELWIARADGTEPRVLSPRPGPDWLPRWLP
jgi:tol-pal system beta propeller repeat protein TolB